MAPAWHISCILGSQICVLQVDNAKALIQPYSEEGMQICVYRYEKLWLPFLKVHRADAKLSAPLDIAWAWFMHTIAPSKYAADLKRLLELDPSQIQAPGPLFDEDEHRVGSYSPKGLSLVSVAALQVYIGPAHATLSSLILPAFLSCPTMHH